MRTSTRRVLRISVTGMGVAALGVGLAGTAAAEESTGGQSTPSYGNGYGNQAGYGYNGYNQGAYGYSQGDYGNGYSQGAYGEERETRSSPLDGLAVPGADGVNGIPGLDGTGGAGGVTDVADLSKFGLPSAYHAADEHELPIISVAGLDQVTEDNGLLNGSGGLNSGLETPGITGLKIPLLD